MKWIRLVSVAVSLGAELMLESALGLFPDGLHVPCFELYIEADDYMSFHQKMLVLCRGAGFSGLSASLCLALYVREGSNSYHMKQHCGLYEGVTIQAPRNACFKV